MGYCIEYQLVGGGSKQRLEQIVQNCNVEENVKFLGSIPHEKIFDWFDTIDIYIQPSNTEGLPRSLIEAMSRGCVCIGSEVGGIPELLENSYTFKKKDIKAIVDLIHNFIDNKDTLIINANKCYSKSLEFTYDKLKLKKDEFYSVIKQKQLEN